MTFFQSQRLFPSLLLLVALSVTSVGLLYLFSNELIYSISADNLKLRELTIHQQNIIYYDEALTMSANMGAQTGDASWKQRYDSIIPKLDDSIRSLMTEVSAKEQQDVMQVTFLSNQKLVELEKLVFQLAEDHKRKEAIEILKGNEYLQEKSRYEFAMREFEQNLEKRKEQIVADLTVKKSRMNVLFVFVGLLVTTFGAISIYIVNKYSRKLTSLNLELEEKVKQRSLELENEKDRSFRAAKLVTVGEVSASIAHDIANPLSVIIARVEILLDSISDSKEKDNINFLKDGLSVISKMSQRILRIVRNIQYLSQSGDQDELETVNVSDLCSQALEIVEEKAKSMDVSLDVFVDKGLSLKGRRTQLVQLLVNLLNNAIDSCENSLKKQVQIRALQVSEQILSLAVKDTGVGISPDIKEKILEPLYTTKEVGKGTGLGLTIVQRIIANHQGQLSIYSTEAGTEFCVKLHKDLPTSEQL